MGIRTPLREREKLEIIGHETTRLTHLVQGVLDISRMDAGGLEILTAPVDPVALCRAAVTRLPDLDGRCHVDGFAVAAFGRLVAVASI